MDKAKALDILRIHNEWRRGADIPMQDPKELGEAIDIAISVLEQALALTWEDIARIDDMLREVENCVAISDLPTMGREEYYSEVLNRFNEIRKK